MQVLRRILSNRDLNHQQKEDAATSSAQAIAAHIEKARQRSALLQESSRQVTAHFYRDEVRTELLPIAALSGEFTHVYAVKELPRYAQPSSEPQQHNIRSDGSTIRSVASTSHMSHSPDEEERRRVCNSGEAYALKTLNPKLVKRVKKKRHHGLQKFHDLAAATLVLEAQYLARLQNPHILKLRGIPLGEECARDAFFFLTDRIVETLAERLDRWKAEEDAQPMRRLKLDVTHPTFAAKMTIAKAIVSALDYLQEQHKIVLLNLNPSTIGFLSDGTVQLFDLGHCREIPDVNIVMAGTTASPTTTATVQHDNNNNSSNHSISERKEPDSDGLSDDELSVDDLSVMLGSQVAMPESNAPIPAAIGGTTTGGHRKVLPPTAAPRGVVPRYLAPELVTRGQFCLKSDAYSFSMVLYEMLTLSRPYAAYQPGQHFVKVCIQGKRPNLNLYQLPPALENLLRKGWKHNWNKRLAITTMKQVLTTVRFDATITTSATNARNASSNSKPERTGMPPPPTARRRGGRRPQRRDVQSLSPRQQQQQQQRKKRMSLPKRPTSERNLLATMISPASRKKQTVHMANTLAMKRHHQEAGAGLPTEVPLMV